MRALAKSNIYTKHQHFLFFLFIVFILPFQQRFFFSSSASKIDNYFIEYNSYYFSTIELLIALFLVVQRKKTLFVLKSILSRRLWFVAFSVITILLTASTLFSENILLSAHKVLHLSLWILFIAIGSNIIKDYFQYFSFLMAIIISSLVQACISIYQFLQQKSVGLSFLGESQISPSILGVAKIDVSSIKMIRAYGTFPHPNMLAAFLLIGLAFTFFCFLRRTSTINIMRRNNFLLNCSTWNNLAPRNAFRIYEMLLYISSLILLLAIFLTFSRMGIILSLPLIFAFSFISRRADRIYTISVSVFCFLLVIIFSSSIISRLQEKQLSKAEPTSLRGIYIDASKRIIMEETLLGSGPGTNVIKQLAISPRLNPWEFQPVHNTYLLIISDMGFLMLITLGLSMAIIVVRHTLIREGEGILWLTLALMLASALFDHYLYSFSQGHAIISLLAIALLSINSIVPRGTIE